MIERFSTLWVGQVQHEDMGFDATPVNERWYDDAYLATPLLTTEKLATLMDSLGFDTLWLAEHHFQPEGYECIPNTLLMATHLAGRTERLRFGTGFNIIPMWHPLRLAEDFAMADILTRGRVRLGVGRGYHGRELESFGAPFRDAEASRDLFEDQVELLMKALKQKTFSHHSENYDVPPAVPYRGYELEELVLVPKPQHPMECWQPVVSASDRGLDFMIRHDIKGFVGGGTASGGASEAVIRRWQEKLAETGRETELGTDLTVGLSFILADSVEEAKRIGLPVLEEYQKMFGPLGFAGDLTDHQLALLGHRETASTAGLGSIDDAIEAGSWVCGPPELLIEKITELQERFPGLQEIMVAQPVGAQPTMVLEQMERFGKEVLPAFG